MRSSEQDLRLKKVQKQSIVFKFYYLYLLLKWFPFFCRENIFIKVVLSSLSVTTFKIAPKEYSAYLCKYRNCSYKLMNEHKNLSSFLVFIADLGGFMGMIMGASWISIIELAIFYLWWIYIIFTFCCKKVKDVLGI